MTKKNNGENETKEHQPNKNGYKVGSLHSQQMAVDSADKMLEAYYKSRPKKK